MIHALTLESGARTGPEERLVPEQLGDLFDAHQARLYRMARRMSGDAEEARDLVQETFLRAARRPGSLPPSEPGREAWLVRTLVNLCRDRRRRRRVRETSPPEPAPAASRFPDPESAAVARVVVESALAQLPPRRRAVVVLHELEERGVAEIAALLGVARVTVRWHLSAGRQELRRILQPGPSRSAEGE